MNDRRNRYSGWPGYRMRPMDAAGRGYRGRGYGPRGSTGILGVAADVLGQALGSGAWRPYGTSGAGGRSYRRPYGMVDAATSFLQEAIGAVGDMAGSILGSHGYGGPPAGDGGPPPGYSGPPIWSGSEGGPVVASTVRPGETAHAYMTVENTSDGPLSSLELGWTPMMASDGEPAISHDAVTVDPREIRVLFPGEAERVAIEIRVPGDVPAGIYRGLVWAHVPELERTEQEDGATVLEVHVRERR